MIIIPPAKQAGAAGKTGSQFTGDVSAYLTMPSTDGVTINTVSFSPCARTYWHSHEKGQIIFVLAGRGLVQAEGGPVFAMRAGDTIWAPPGERHWHGASPGSFVTHTAISLGVTSWAEPVSDDQFNAPHTTEEPK
ncbi:MAG TPA: cupin domain-containing protein [Acidimicrobiales bacterium]|nr:cupin domain-containing protein [Acidimicrobiales bacterium]